MKWSVFSTENQGPQDGGMVVATKGHSATLEMFYIKMAVMIIWQYTFVKAHQIAILKLINFIVSYISIKLTKKFSNIKKSWQEFWCFLPSPILIRVIKLHENFMKKKRKKRLCLRSFLLEEFRQAQQNQQVLSQVISLLHQI